MNNRRTVLGLLAAAALTLCLSLPGFAPAADAAEASPARKALEVSISRVLDCIKNPDYVNPATRPPLRRQIEDEVYHIFDFGEDIYGLDIRIEFKKRLRDMRRFDSIDALQAQLNADRESCRALF